MLYLFGKFISETGKNQLRNSLELHKQTKTLHLQRSNVMGQGQRQHVDKHVKFLVSGTLHYPIFIEATENTWLK